MPAPPATHRVEPARRPGDRLHGAWLGRAAGCLLGKPVEKIPRHGHPGDPAEPRATGRSRGYFTAARPARRGRRAVAVEPAQRADQPGREHRRDARGRRPQLPAARARPARAARCRASRPTTSPTPGWPTCPAGRVFTAERVAYRNLLLGEAAPARGRDSAQPVPGVDRRADPRRRLRLGPIPATPRAAARLAWTGRSAQPRPQRGLRRDVRGRDEPRARRGRPTSATRCSRRARASSRRQQRSPRRSASGASLGRSRAADRGRRWTRSTPRYGHLHWVHVLNNAALVAYALTASARRLHHRDLPPRSWAAGTPTRPGPPSGRSAAR